MTDKYLISQRYLAKYIGVNVLPEVCTLIQSIAPGTQPSTEDEYKSLKRKTSFMQKTRELNFTSQTCTKLVLFTDASFENARGMSSQLVYLIVMV